MTYYMITNRNVLPDRLGNDHAPKMTFWITDNDNVTALASWKSISADEFKRTLLGVAQAFPDLPIQEHADQKHVTLFIHGYNNTWTQAAARYKTICERMFSGADSMGICILFTWPSDGEPWDYLPDRQDSRASAPDLAEVLNEFYDWLLVQQKLAAIDSSKACRAKTSIICHSMGNYVLERAMRFAWTRNNQPLLISLVNQLLMVAADVDNDLFDQANPKGDGTAISNLSYRVTAFYTGRDPVLGVSAGLKHFGKRRLGRSGIDRTKSLPDNVWDIDCTNLIEGGAKDVHSAYFDSEKSIEVMRRVLRGDDRKLLRDEFGLP